MPKTNLSLRAKDILKGIIEDLQADIDENSVEITDFYTCFGVGVESEEISDREIENGAMVELRDFLNQFTTPTLSQYYGFER